MESQQSFTCLKSTMETLKKVVLVSLLLIVNIFYTTFFDCFCCSLWTVKYFLGSSFMNLILKDADLIKCALKPRYTVESL